MARRRKPYVNPRETWDTGWTPRTAQQAGDGPVPEAPVEPIPQFDDPAAPVGTNHIIAQQDQEGRLTQERLNGAPYEAGAFLDSAKAGLMQGLVPVLLGDLYEEYEFNIKAKLDGTYGKETPLNLTPDMVNGLTEAEVEDLENSHNQTHALFKLERFRAAADDYARMGAGSLATRFLAPMVGQLPESLAIGIVGGTAGAAIGRQVGQNILSKGGSAASAIGAQRLTGGIAGNLLSGAGAEAIGTLYDPYRGWEDVVGAAVFDTAGYLGAVRGAAMAGGDKAMWKTTAAKVAEVKSSVADWVKRGDTGTPPPARQDITPEAAYSRLDESPPARPQDQPEIAAPGSLGKLEDVSWATPQELTNLGIRTFTTPEGKVLRNDGSTSVFDMPEGTYDSATGITSRGQLPDIAVEEIREVAVGGNVKAPLPTESARSAEQVDEIIHTYVEQMGYTPAEAALAFYTRQHPDAAKYRWVLEDGVYYQADDVPPQLVKLAKALNKEWGNGETPLVLGVRFDKDPSHGMGWATFSGGRARAITLNGLTTGDRPVTKHAVAIENGVNVLLHEFGHNIAIPGIAKMSEKGRSDLRKALNLVREISRDPKRLRKAAVARFGHGDYNYLHAVATASPDTSLIGWLAGSNDPKDIKAAEAYWLNWDEITAQQFVKHVQRNYAKMAFQNPKRASKKSFLPGADLARWIQLTVGKMRSIFFRELKDDLPERELARLMDNVFMELAGIYQKGAFDSKGAVNALKDSLDPHEPRYHENFAVQSIRDKSSPAQPKPEKVVPEQVPEGKDEAPESPEPLPSYEVSGAGKAYGLHLTNQEKPEELAGVIMMDRVLNMALEEAPPPVQKERTSRLLRHDRLKGTKVSELFVSASQIALGSKNPIARWVGGMVAESPSNAVGQRNNRSAAVTRFKLERKILSSTLYELRQAQKAWYKEQGIAQWRALFSSEHAERWNKELQRVLHETHTAQEIPEGTSPAVTRAVKAMAEMHERANKIEVEYGTVGSRDGDIPPALGYMQRILDPSKIAELTVPQKQRVIAAIQAQLRDNAGFSGEVAKRVATRYLDRAEKARGGVFTPQEAALDSPDSIRTLQDILRKEGHSEDEISALTGPLLRGKEKHFHRKLQLDENMDLGDGVTLGDLMWNDHAALLRDRARSTAGWAAMASTGIHGYEGMRAVMAALGKGSGENLATPEEIRAVEQILSEVSSVPLEGRYYSAALDGTVAATSVIRLGGIGWTSVAEVFNVANHVGAMNALQSVPLLNKLRKDVQAAARGEKIDDPFLADFERYTGHTFGTDGYFLASPWDDSGKNRDLKGSEEQSKWVRNINALGYAQQILSGFRIITATSQRYAARVTVEQALNRIKVGDAPDTWLKDIGIDEDLFSRVKGQLERATEAGPDGKIIMFHARRLDPGTLDDLSSAVFRSVNQMIQGTFAGERGAYVHDSFWRTMTQFRGYSLTALEKQLGRQIGNYGHTKVALMLAANMAAALPLVILRTYVASLGREEEARKKFLEQHLAPAELIQKASTYVSLSGLASDVVDIVQDATGSNPYGSRAIGDRIAPAAGVINDLYGAPTNPAKALSLIPLTGLPLVVPVTNHFKQEIRDLQQDDE